MTTDIRILVMLSDDHQVVRYLLQEFLENTEECGTDTESFYRRERWSKGHFVAPALADPDSPSLRYSAVFGM